MTTSKKQTAGICAILGSGETTDLGRRVLSRILPQLEEPRTIAVLDTPAGFQPNHIQVAEKIVRLFTEKLAEFRPHPTIVEARRATLDTTVGAMALATLARAACIVAGPGSPSYMVRELEHTPYLDAIRQGHANGAAIYVSSAAAIALSTFSLPVYEIFKAGQYLHWMAGLDFFAPFGMCLAIVPHWNNREGGAAVDTHFCYMGKTRFEELRSLLPSEMVVLGIDEHTACILDFATDTVSVEGKGGVHLLRDGQILEWLSGDTFSVSLLQGNAQAIQPSGPSFTESADSLPSRATTLDSDTKEEAESAAIPPTLIDAVLAVRAELRRMQHWTLADQLRDALAACGIVVEDTPTGSQWHVAEME